jgi:hypothetical protein
MSQLFTRLPNDILRSILNDWCKGKAIARLDSACCSTDHRKEFLTLLTTLSPLSCADKYWDSRHGIRWWLLRGLRTTMMEQIEPNFVRELLEAINLTDPLLQANLNKFLSSINRLAFWNNWLSPLSIYNPDHDVAQLINLCTNLRTIELLDTTATGDLFTVVDYIWDKIDPTRLANLTTLKFSTSNVTEPTTSNPELLSLIQFLSLTTKNLTTLHFYPWDDASTLTHFCNPENIDHYIRLLHAVVHSNPHLQDLHCNIPKSLSQFIKGIESLSNPRLTTIMIAVQNNPQLCIHPLQLIGALQNPLCPLRKCIIVKRLPDGRLDKILHYRSLSTSNMLQFHAAPWARCNLCKNHQNEWYQAQLTSLVLGVRALNIGVGNGKLFQLGNIKSLQFLIYNHHPLSHLTKGLQKLLSIPNSALTKVYAITSQDTNTTPSLPTNASVANYLKCVQDSGNTKTLVIFINHRTTQNQEGTNIITTTITSIKAGTIVPNQEYIDVAGTLRLTT